MKKTKLIMIGIVIGIAIVLGRHRTSQSSNVADTEEVTA